MARPSTDTAEQVADLLGLGCTLWDVSRILGVRPESLIRACERAEQYDIADAVRDLIAKDKEAVRQCLRSAA